MVCPPCSSAVHGVLASLPNMTPDALQRFAQQLLGTGSEKAQRDLTKKMLVSRQLGAGSYRIDLTYSFAAASLLAPTMLLAACMRVTCRPQSTRVWSARCLWQPPC